MDIKMLGYFRALCDCGSFGRAALACGISSQGVAAAVRRMESELGCKLVETGADGVRVTKYGAFLRDASAEMCESWDRLERKVKIELDHDRNVLRVGLIHGFEGYVGKRMLDEVTGRHPGLIYDRALTEAEVEEGLAGGRYEIAVDALPSQNLAVHPLVDEPFYLWVNVKNPLAKRKDVRIADLSGQTVCMIDMSDWYTERIHSILSDGKASVDFLPVDEMILALEYAMRNEAVGVTARSHVEAILVRDVVGIPILDWRFRYYICHMPDHQLTEEEQAFVQDLRDLCRPWRQ